MLRRYPRVPENKSVSRRIHVQAAESSGRLIMVRAFFVELVTIQSFPQQPVGTVPVGARGRLTGKTFIKFK